MSSSTRWAVRVGLPLLLFALLVVGPGVGQDDTPVSEGWASLVPGLELGRFPSPVKAASGDSVVTIARIDPKLHDVRLLAASARSDRKGRTARKWCEETGCVAAINASMYQTDGLTSVGLMVDGDHANNRHLIEKGHFSVLALDPVGNGEPPVALIDRKCDPFEERRQLYRTLVQSIRMISCNRKNVWSPQERAWSTAAIGIDREGRLLFIHARSPFPTHDLIEGLLALPIGVARAMYAEGGSEAQLFVSAGGVEVEEVGDRGSIVGMSGNMRAWPVPNVIGVFAKTEETDDGS